MTVWRPVLFPGPQVGSLADTSSTQAGGWGLPSLWQESQAGSQMGPWGVVSVRTG